MIKTMFKKKLFWLAVLAFLGIILSYFVKHPVASGLCLSSEPSCIVNLSLFGIGMFYGMIGLTVSFAALLFAPRAISSWWGFAVLYALFYIYRIIATAPRPGGMFANLGFSVQETAMWLSVTFVVATFGIIAWVYRKNK